MPISFSLTPKILSGGEFVARCIPGARVSLVAGLAGALRRENIPTRATMALAFPRPYRPSRQLIRVH
jgi:hypothetical protein